MFGFTLFRNRWTTALALVRERNAERILERGELPEDDVTTLLHVYCKGLAQAQPGNHNPLFFVLYFLHLVAILKRKTRARHFRHHFLLAVW